MFDYGKKTYLMGILNVTPDSFSDGGSYTSLERALNHAKEMINEGADIIDIGGESTRPGHEAVDEDEELRRVIPVLKALKEKLNIKVSIDTYKAKVAEESLKLGADMINDVWGLRKDPKMANTIAKYDAYVCIMHNQDGTYYEKDIMKSIEEFFIESIKIAKESGISNEKIILDPGIGFGKTFEQNIEVMSRLNELKKLEYPILLGTSRKSMIGNILNVEPKERVEGTMTASVLGINAGVDIVRVHDIKANLRAIKVTDAICRK